LPGIVRDFGGFDLDLALVLDAHLLAVLARVL
jgi:hypothetical protein